MDSTKIYVCSKVLGNITKEQHAALFTIIEGALPCTVFGDVFIDSYGFLRVYLEGWVTAEEYTITKEGEIQSC